ncbi:MotA/TolQ/ExbB proton channel family protein [Nitrosococcus oceani]|uniref:Outer membrane transport energization protein ExbB n=2 Tax=Nitrosococcus oceani TaxID=1229 RepID=Q3JDG9_NITOC|nr:MotA/TolQ/ExbB proton channel family protein [Nitrosococcus oceani]KFI20388.1 biopolymer transporter ExbB [Nitrosococcus oceani C-27]ABA57127.1 outer membrane transport energization protein ExbB [Nitrosococcus oceani ATCC 19707]EDZ65456.1 transporter, MotA/TolQ/ExbB proton channel family, putative [Nitrosococcus oceani AFC27]KFI23538.1 biopolymer transporter ExbB [Nitrosococcus oceani]GEM19853.1 flagellar motor protein MotA [Nitrosococcus oceani]
MGVLSESLFRIELLLEKGGIVLWLILMASLLMWALIVERYYFLLLIYPARLQQFLKQWQQRQDRQSWYAQRIREGMVAEISASLHRFLLPIKTLAAVLPMLGLLGTVMGMIQVFDVMTVFGTGNARGFAGGISIALITTMAGLVTALSGLYFSANLEHRAQRAIQHTRDSLRRE